MKLFLFLVFLVIFLLHKPNVIEGFKPNEEKFFLCNTNSGKGETNFIKKTNPFSGPLSGFYSALIKDEKNHSSLFTSPTCMTSKKVENDYFNDNKVIDHSENTWEPPLDPLDKYAKPDNNDAILYNKDLWDVIVGQHEKYNQKEILSRV